MAIGKKFSGYQNNRNEHLMLRTFKAISFATKLMIEKDSKVLTVADYDKISLEVYRNKSVSNRMRIYKLMQDPVIRDKINQNLLDYYNAKNINLNEKVESLINKAETLAKSTNDCINLANFYKEVTEMGSNIVKNNNLTQINNFNAFVTDSSKEVKIEESIDEEMKETNIKTEE